MHRKNVSFMSFTDRLIKTLIYNNRYLLVIDGIKNTLLIASFASILGCFMGLFVCLLRLSKSKVFEFTATIYTRFFQTIPILLLLMLMYYVVFASSKMSGIAVSIVTFSFYHSAYTAEIFRSGVKSVKNEQIEASYSMGFTKTQTYMYIVLPQAVRVIFPAYKSEFMTLIKLTSVVGIVGVRDLTRATEIIRSQTFDAFFPIFLSVIMYLIIITILTLTLETIEKAMYPRLSTKMKYNITKESIQKTNS